MKQQRPDQACALDLALEELRHYRSKNPADGEELTLFIDQLIWLWAERRLIRDCEPA